MVAGTTAPPSAGLFTAACPASIRAGSSPLGTELFETNDLTISAARSIGFDVVTVVLTAIYFASPRLRHTSRFVDSRGGNSHQFLHPNQSPPPRHIMSSNRPAEAVPPNGVASHRCMPMRVLARPRWWLPAERDLDCPKCRRG